MYLLILPFLQHVVIEMEVVKFNEEIFDALVNKGFKYCYSKTIADEEYPGQINIVLTPLKFRPDIRKLPEPYDTYFKLTEEPKQMASGIDNDTFVFINLKDTLLKEFYEQKNINHR